VITVPIRKSIKTLSLCFAALSLTACSSHSLFSASSSGVCGVAAVQPCGHVHGGQINSGYYAGNYMDSGNYMTSGGEIAGSRYGTVYQQYDMAYPALRPMAYVPPTVNYGVAPQPVTPPVLTPYEPVIVTPTPAPLPAPTIISDPLPIADTPPPLSNWEQTPPRSAWDARPVDDEICPPGTIAGYSGSGCVQVAIPRK